MSRKYDAIVIGTGQSGPSLANRFCQSGMEVAVIERKSFGEVVEVPGKLHVL